MDRPTWGLAKTLGFVAGCFGVGGVFAAVMMLTTNMGWSVLAISLFVSGFVSAAGVHSARPRAERPIHVAWGSAFFVLALLWVFTEPAQPDTPELSYEVSRPPPVVSHPPGVFVAGHSWASPVVPQGLTVCEAAAVAAIMCVNAAAVTTCATASVLVRRCQEARATGAREFEQQG